MKESKGWQQISHIALESSRRRRDPAATLLLGAPGGRGWQRSETAGRTESLRQSPQGGEQGVDYGVPLAEIWRSPPLQGQLNRCAASWERPVWGSTAK